MAFAPGTPVRYPIVNCDLADVRGAPGVPAGRGAARRMSTPATRWRARSAGTGVFLDTAVGTDPLGSFERRMLGSSAARTVATFRSSVGEQVVRQQLWRDRPVVGARYRAVAMASGGVVVGAPVADLDRRDPGRARRRTADEVADAVREHLSLAPRTPVDVERVVFPVEGTALWAFRARVVDGVDDVRAYVRADDLSLLYAQDVSCAALLGEGRVFRVNPGRDAADHVVRLGQFVADDGLLATSVVRVAVTQGRAVSNRGRDFRIAPDADGFEQVSAFHHVGAAVRWFVDLLGDEVVAGEPFTPLTVVVQDRAARPFVGLFLPGRGEITLADQPHPAARSGDVCVHELTHAVVHRIARLDDEFATPLARGINEGFADYAQATIFDDPRFGDWVRDQPAGARTCDDPTHRIPADPVDPGDRYVVGQAWAAALWDLRRELGAGVADAVAFHALQFLVPGTDHDLAREALHQADAALFPGRRAGRHRAVIDDALDGRTA